MTRFSHQTLSELSKSVTRYVKQHSIPENAAQGQRPGIDSVGGGITKLVPIGGKEIQYHIIVDFLFRKQALFSSGDALMLCACKLFVLDSFPTIGLALSTFLGSNDTLMQQSIPLEFPVAVLYNGLSKG